MAKKLDLNRIEQIRRDFIANVSHELRTPLTVITGYLEVLLEQPHFEDRWLRVFSQMQNQTDRMQRLVEDLLLLSSIESAELPTDAIAEIDMTALLSALCDDAKSLSGKKQHRIHLEVDQRLRLMGEKKEIRSAFSNIVFNAVRYTPAGGDIYLKWFVEDHQKVFSVKDTGIGIDQKHLSRITERFYRVDAGRSRDAGGTGLGLAIVKHVMIRHHAQLNISSQLNEGSEFRCLFPLESAA